MLRFSASFLLLLTGTFTLAQAPNEAATAPQNPSTNTFTVGHYDYFSCPVGFTASRQAPVQMMTADDAREAGPMQGLHLTLRNVKDMPAIESIEVTVYGTSMEGLVLPVGRPSTRTVSKTFVLRRASDDTTLRGADVSMHLVGSLSWANLISITYADGHTWRASGDSQCHAVPSNFLLVGSR
jgi:hypothetical protein